MAGRGTDILLGGNPAGLASEILHKRGLNPAEVIYQRPAVVDETQWALLVAEEKPRVLFHYFGEALQARQAMNERLAMTQAPPSARFWIEGFYIAEALGDRPLMTQCLDQARAADPQAPVLADLEGRLKAGKPK
jgi:preprotein translocase subunit SecA